MNKLKGMWSGLSRNGKIAVSVLAAILIVIIFSYIV